jgi:uncharacterized protein (DUF1330 family)
VNALKRDLSKNISVEIIPAGQWDVSVERIWAINWFNYKNKWLYGLYNKLVASHVIEVGGQLLFKGHNQQTLFGDEKFARETLLIVAYPKIDSFLEMLTINAFQLKSLLRFKSVRDFIFGFTKRVDKNEFTPLSKFNGSDSYLVYHFQGKVDQNKLYELARDNNVRVFFHGEKMAQIKRSESGKEDVLAPFFMDGIIVFETDSKEITEKFAANEGFLQHKTLNKSSYVAIFARER